MNRQTLQAKESAPTKKKSSFSWLRPAAAHLAAETEHEAPSASSPAFAHDFTKVPVRPMQLPGVPGFSCPFAPQRCPSGGACHTCPPKMQAKLKIGQPGDRYEQEADRVAETVMRMPEPQVQRKCSAPGCKDEDEDKLVQAKSAGSAGNAQVDHPLIQSVLSSPGQPLDAGTRSFMEPRFGQDFSGVRVHTDGQAAESARAVNARAYTVGRDVVFGEGQYTPGSDEGKRLVAHELAHVGQNSLMIHLEGDSSALPASFRANIGDINYYRFRNKDYLARHKTPPPPDYYLNYGDKYAHKFKLELRKELSLTGQWWVDSTFNLLQEAIEKRRDNIPSTFDLLEQDSDKFRTFAYGTHKNAYLEGGLRYLPMTDLWKIAKTPDIGDLLTFDGIEQMIGTGITLIPQWGGNVVESAERAVGGIERSIYQVYGAPYIW